jgi:hypothetical protein
MGDMPTDYPTRLDLAELVARIERQQEETRKFISEQHKLDAEAAKLPVDRYMVPVVAILTLIAALGGLGGILAGAQAILRWRGVAP